MNLLENPGIEAGWTRATHTDQEYGEIFVPEGWVAFWRTGHRWLLECATQETGMTL